MKKWLENQLEKALFYFIRRKRERLRLDFNRVLPVNELLTDRWEKAKYLGFGEGSSVYDSCLVFGDVRVGKNTWIGPFVILDGSGGLKIGNNCSISAGVHIYTHSSVKWAISGGEMEYEYASVCIADNCFIGPHSIIQKGVKIGRCSVIAANSFVNKDVGEYEIVGGTPANKIGRVIVNENEGYKLYFED